ncbi:M66 family metalloprotease [Psychrobacter sp.]|uniref:M66 family metalloprotease n=1 Tax=Psychrobacter sp. TaxID=56811 RepID=UPI003562B66C
MIFPLKALNIGIFSIMLTACGEGSDTPPPVVNPPVTIPGMSIPATPLEPSTPIKPPVTSIPATPLEPSTPIKPPVTSIPATPLEPSTPIKPPVTSIPATPLEPSTPIKPPVTSIPSTPIEPATPIKYPEPQKDIADYYLLGFFDYDGVGETREIRSDLLGSFQAMIQFGQSHTVDPQGNEEKNMPRLTAEKDALLLVTPTLEMGVVDQLVAEIYQDSLLLRRVHLDDPTHLPLSDQTNSDDRPRVTYSKRAWSTRLNWDEVKAGLKIRIVDEQNRSGELLENKIDFAAPGELVLTNIRLGLLSPVTVNSGHYMLLQPEKAGADYFQTIPAAQMTVAKYDDVVLDRVMVANGTIYDMASGSASAGDVYNGDMRENTGKSTFGVGINLANWGITSASMLSQEQPQLTQNVNAHHARGKYANGIFNHGLSGGNGMLTLIDSVGNEFSHEIGHHYGLGHYPGKVGDKKFWSEHHADSGWGFMPLRNRMRGNFEWWRKDVGAGTEDSPTFLSQYGYGRDAMSGGSNNSDISRYTHYTGFSTKTKIQPAFDRYMFASDSMTGYKRWNADLRKMEVAQPKVPKSNNVWYNSADGNYLRPRLQGVPVYTILGGYDPVTQKGIIYPAARGNWGNVFDLPAASTSADVASCWLAVTYSNNMVNNIALAPNRINGNSNANKLHVNLAISENPSKVDLYCKKANEAQVLLSSTAIGPYIDTIKPAVTFGKEHGFSALRKIELPLLEQQLIDQAANPTISLDANGELIYHSYKTDRDELRQELSPQAFQTLERYEQQQAAMYRLNRWVNVYRTDLDESGSEVITAFQTFVKELGLQDDQPLANVSPLLNGKNCLKVETLADGKLNAFISGPSACTGDDSEQWTQDTKGRIHNKMALDQCLMPQGGNVINLAPCDDQASSQVWQMDVTTNAIKQGNQCFDLENGYLNNNRARLIRYGCNNGGNQKWTMLTKNPSLILATAGNNLPLIVQSLQKQPAMLNSRHVQSLNMDSKEDSSVLAKVGTAISTFIDDLFS